MLIGVFVLASDGTDIDGVFDDFRLTTPDLSDRCADSFGRFAAY